MLKAILFCTLLCCIFAIGMNLRGCQSAVIGNTLGQEMSFDDISETLSTFVEDDQTSTLKLKGGFGGGGDNSCPKTCQFSCDGPLIGLCDAKVTISHPGQANCVSGCLCPAKGICMCESILRLTKSARLNKDSEITMRIAEARQKCALFCAQ